VKTLSLRMGSRGSRLAVAQTAWVASELKKKNPDLHITFHEIKTTGDKDQRSSLTQIGGKGVFVKEIEEALLQNEIDLAVHSLKDLPQMIPGGLMLGPFPKRESPFDAVISRFGELLQELPRGSIVGTSSPRRTAQISHRYKNRYRLESIRGNVETRIKKLKDGHYDAIILAVAGLKRLGLDAEITEVLEPEQMLPAPCQGSLGLEFREQDDEKLTPVLETIRDPQADMTARAERAFLQALGGSCLLPVGAFSKIEGDELVIKACLLTNDGSKRIDTLETGEQADPELVGAKCAERLLYEGGSEIIYEIEKNS